MARDVIIGQQRVIDLLAFFATPFSLFAIPGDVVALFLGSVALGVFLLFIEPLRSVGVGLLAGTVVTLGVLLLLGTMLSGSTEPAGASKEARCGCACLGGITTASCYRVDSETTRAMQSGTFFSVAPAK